MTRSIILEGGPLLQLNGSASALTSLILSARAGARLAQPSKKTPDLLDSLDRSILRLSKEVQQLDRRQGRGLNEFEDAMIEEADLADELKKWQERRDTLLTDRAVEQGLIELTDDAHHIASVLYPSRNASFGLPMMDPPMDEKRALKSQVMERDDLVVELAKVQDRLNGLQDQLTSAQDEVQDTIRQCQRTYYRLKTQEDPHFRDGADTIKEEEKEELERCAQAWREHATQGIILSQVLQGIIFESGMDWSKTEEWREVVLSLGRPPSPTPPFRHG